MELYNNMYQYLRQTKMAGYWDMKESGEVSWLEKINLNASSVKAVYPGMQSNEETAVQEKLGKIRAKLRAGARLTTAEKNFLRKHDPQLYLKVMALEQEAAAYEERLKRCHTRDDAERIKTQKLAEMAADLKKEDADYLMIRLNQMKEAEKKTSAIVSRKPWQRDLDKKQMEERKRIKKKEEKAAKKKRAQKKRREEAARKEKMEEEIRKEAAQKKKIEEERLMKEKAAADELEEKQMEMRQETVLSELMTGEEMTEEQIAKFMIAAGMMDMRATRIQVPDTADEIPVSPAPPSLGNSTGYAAYRAAVYMPELAELEEEKKPYIRRA